MTPDVDPRPGELADELITANMSGVHESLRDVWTEFSADRQLHTNTTSVLAIMAAGFVLDLHDGDQEAALSYVREWAMRVKPDDE